MQINNEIPNAQITNVFPDWIDVQQFNQTDVNRDVVTTLVTFYNWRTRDFTLFMVKVTNKSVKHDSHVINQITYQINSEWIYIEVSSVGTHVTSSIYQSWVIWYYDIHQEVSVQNHF